MVAGPRGARGGATARSTHIGSPRRRRPRCCSTGEREERGERSSESRRACVEVSKMGKELQGLCLYDYACSLGLSVFFLFCLQGNEGGLKRILQCTLVDRRASLEEQPGDFEVALLARDAQRREAVIHGLAVVLGLVDRRASLEEQQGAIEAALLARQGGGHARGMRRAAVPPPTCPRVSPPRRHREVAAQCRDDPPGTRAAAAWCQVELPGRWRLERCRALHPAWDEAGAL